VNYDGEDHLNAGGTIRERGGAARTDMVPEPFDTASPVRINSASGKELRPLFRRTLMPSILDETFEREL
jgi:hypothetical protein